MKETLKNEIVCKLANAIIGTNEQLHVNIVVSKVDQKTENVLITYEKRTDTEPKIILDRNTKSGYAWAAGLIMTLSKIKFFNTNVIIINDGLPY